MGMDIKMTKLAECAGCGAKVGAGMLSCLLQGMPVLHDERLLVGYDTSDDASVYYLSDEQALVQTIDFFPPIVDDPFTYGQIAAANAISDIYAMGGEPKLAMNILCIAPAMSDEAVRAVLRGGYEKAYEAGTIITGGHSILDKEPKYGMAVTGFVHPARILRNDRAREGDVLILTKPLGIGIITTANKADLADAAAYAQAIEQMMQLNKTARDIMVRHDISSCTDVTGFALLGHALEMARGGKVTAVLDSGNLPLLPGVLDLAEMGILPDGVYRNRHFAEAYTRAAASVSLAMQDIMYDPQTSGGLLMAVKESEAMTLLHELQDSIACAAIVGHIEKKHEDCFIYIR